MEVVGSVAAALQLADVALQSLITIYSVARGMKEVPKKLQEVFRDLESFAGLLANLGKEASQPESRFTRAPAWQVHSLVASLKAAAACSDALKASLTKVLPSPGDSKLKRTWRAFASLPREHDIFVQCDRLQRLKLDIQLDLQNVGISLMNLANSSLDDIKAHTGAGGYAQVSASLDTVTSRLVAIEVSNHRIENLAQAMHQMVLSEGTGRASTDRSTHGPHEAMHIDENAVEMKKAAIECCRHLANYPTDLAMAAASSNSWSQDEQSTTYTPYNMQLNTSQDEFCSCMGLKTVSRCSFGPIELVSSHTTVHDASCPIFATIKEKTTQTIRARLRPFINKTVEIVLKSSFGYGGCSRSQSLNYYNTVSRQLSPAFQLFDRINLLGSGNDAYDTLKRMTAKQQEYNTPSARYMTWAEDTTFTYDMSLIAPYSDDEMIVLLDKMQLRLEDMFQSGTALPNDRDEFGNTLIHELLFTWHHLRTRSPARSGYAIRKFASYLHRRGVDFGASVPVVRSSTVIGSEQTFSFTISSNLNLSVGELAYYALFEQRKSIKSSTEVAAGLQMPVPSTILSKLGIEVGSSLLGNRFDGAVERIHRRSCLLDLATMSPTSHDILYDIQLNALHYAIFQRSRDRVISLMQKYPPEEEKFGATCPFSVVECSFGWTGGLKLLCAAGYNVFDAVELAVYRQDMNLLKLLLSESDLSTSILKYALCLDCYSHSSKSRSAANKAFNIWGNKDFNRKVMAIFVSTIKSRRENLRQLALGHLPVALLQSLCLDAPETILLDTKAAKTGQILDEYGIYVPIYLRPGDTPIFHSFDMCCPEGGLHLADALYKAGFTEVHAPNGIGSTRLQLLVNDLGMVNDTIAWYGATASAVKWLVNHGACTDVGRGTKPLLHVLAEFYDGHRVKEWDCEHDGSLLFWLHREYERAEPLDPHIDIFAGYGQRQDSDIVIYECDSNSESGSNCSTVNSSARSIASTTCYMGDIEDERVEVDDTIKTRHETSSSSDRSEPAPRLHTGRSREPESPETRARRELLQAVAGGYTTLGDGCDCYCSSVGCLPTHKLPTLFMPATDTGGWVKPWKQIQNDFFSWISNTTTTPNSHRFPRRPQISDSQVREYLEGAIRREIFERLSMAHTCCHGQTIRSMSEETRKELQEEDAEAKTQLDLFMTAFDNLISSPRRRSWPARRVWTYWWSIVDEILPPLLPWERGMRYCVPVEKLPAAVECVLLDVSAERHDNTLRKAGYYPDRSPMDFVDVIKCHLKDFLDCHEGASRNIDTVVKGGPLPVGEKDFKAAKGRKTNGPWPRSQNRNNDSRSERKDFQRDAFGKALAKIQRSVRTRVWN